MQFIQCKNCETIIMVKDLKMPWTEEILKLANAENTIKGEVLCAACQTLEDEKKNPLSTPQPEESEE